MLLRAGRVIAVEKDDRLIPILRQKFATEIASGKLGLIHADILNYELGIRNYGNRYKLVANIPYYITGAFIRKFLESDTQPSAMALLLQKEVAKRIVARDGKESILSISVKAYGTPIYIDTVKAGAFSPPPKVDSAIIAIENISKSIFSDGLAQPPTVTRFNLVKEREKRFFELLKKGFAHPRKLLASNLGVDSEKLIQCGIAEKSRAENLTLQQWRSLVAALYSH